MDRMGETNLDEASSRRWWIEWPTAASLRSLELRGRLTVGRSKLMDVVVDDPYVSRDHCILELDHGAVRVDSSHGTNVISVDGREVKQARFVRAGSFSIGQTTLRLRLASDEEETTLYLSHTAPRLVFRRSTREVLAADGTLIAQLSTSEAAAFEAIAGRYPDAADHATLAQAIWGDHDYPRYLIHRLIQRLRDRLGDHGTLIENVRGAGYRLRGPLEMR
jgi:hypothetical protein